MIGIGQSMNNWKEVQAWMACKTMTSTILVQLSSYQLGAGHVSCDFHKALSVKTLWLRQYLWLNYLPIGINYYAFFVLKFSLQETTKTKNASYWLWQSLHTSQVSHQAEAYFVFCSMKRLVVFLLTPGWDVSLSECYPWHKVCQYLGRERHCESKVTWPRTQHSVPIQGSNLDCLIWRRAH